MNVESRTNEALQAFDWDRASNLNYLDSFFAKWGYEPFVVPRDEKPTQPKVVALPRKIEPTARAFREYKRLADDWRFFDPHA